MHHGVGQFAIGRHEQKPAGIDIQPADSNPARALNFWKAVKNCWPALWVGAGGYLTGGFVVYQVALNFTHFDNRPLTVTQADTVTDIGCLPDACHHLVDAYFTILNL